MKQKKENFSIKKCVTQQLRILVVLAGSKWHCFWRCASWCCAWLDRPVSWRPTKWLNVASWKWRQPHISQRHNLLGALGTERRREQSSWGNMGNTQNRCTRWYHLNSWTDWHEDTNQNKKQIPGKFHNTYFSLEDDAMLKGFVWMEGNPQVEVVIGHLAVVLLVSSVERHSPRLVLMSAPVTKLLEIVDN